MNRQKTGGRSKPKGYAPARDDVPVKKRAGARPAHSGLVSSGVGDQTRLSGGATDRERYRQKGGEEHGKQALSFLVLHTHSSRLRPSPRQRRLGAVELEEAVLEVRNAARQLDEAVGRDAALALEVVQPADADKLQGTENKHEHRPTAETAVQPCMEALI